ncbi:MAG: glutamate synthase subunit beta [Kofleriaceae bacterium]
MGKITGFLETGRAAPHRRPVAERLRDWREVEQVGADSREQAGRCMDCGVPFCTQGCPLGNAIPDFADAVYRGRWEDAYRKLAVTNDFAEFTGRLCPAPCEAACVLAIASPAVPGGAAAPHGGAVTNGAVTIEALEHAISDRAFAEGWVTPLPRGPSTGKTIAVVGSGPAGLAAAIHLAAAGHTVTVFEAGARAGGLLRYGIPDFKLDKAIIDRRLAVMPDVELRCGVEVGVAGRGPTWRALVDEHDAVVLTIGAQRPRDLDLPGRDLAGVMLALDYLVEQNQVVAGERELATHDVRGKRVVILGGGDTGSDCLGTALRQGAAEVTQIELVPAPPIGRNPETPWPAWPLVFRTSSSQEEGGSRTFGFRTTHLEGDLPGNRGRLVALHGIAVERRAGQLVDLPGTELRLDCDVLVLALGFTGPSAQPLVDQLGVRLDPRGNIAVDRDFETNVRGVFCAGDARRGASLVVWAIAEGRELARAVDRSLRSLR